MFHFVFKVLFALNHFHRRQGMTDVYACIIAITDFYASIIVRQDRRSYGNSTDHFFRGSPRIDEAPLILFGTNVADGLKRGAEQGRLKWFAAQRNFWGKLGKNGGGRY
jgi:hypothetical protein